MKDSNNNQVPEVAAPLCPFCGLASVNQTVGHHIYKDGAPFMAIYIQHCGIGHAWYEFAHWSPELDTFTNKEGDGDQSATAPTPESNAGD